MTILGGALTVIAGTAIVGGLWRVLLYKQTLNFLLARPAVPLGKGWNKVRAPSISRFYEGVSTMETQTGSSRALRVVTRNLLAPCYHKPEGRLESHNETVWQRRLEEQLQLLAELRVDIILLQEWWHASSIYREHWFKWALKQRMSLFVTPRTSGKPDGLAVLLSADLKLTQFSFSELSFNDWGDRVVQIFQFDAWGSSWIIANTHLTYPHRNSYDPPMREHQGRKLGEALSALSEGKRLVVGGDFNGNRLDVAVRNVVHSAGLALNGVDDATHRDHRGNTISCDFAMTRGLAVVERRLGGFDGCLDKGAHFCSDHRPLLVALLPEEDVDSSACT